VIGIHFIVNIQRALTRKGMAAVSLQRVRIISERNWLLRIAPGAIVGFLLAICASWTHGQERAIWQIGKHDNSSLEFNQQWNFSGGKNPLFVIGKSDPRKDWSNFQPAAGDPSIGARVHPFTIQFDLSNDVRGTFYLVIDLFFRGPLIPGFLVGVNGKEGTFKLHPTHTYNLGNPEMFDNIIPSIEQLRIPLASSFFRSGENRITLNAVGESGTTIFPEPVQTELNGSTGVYYDDVLLTNDPNNRSAGTYIEAEAHPTIFYRHGKDGQLKEVVLLEARTGRQSKRGHAALFLGKKVYSCDLPSDQDFGESECAVEVQEFTAKVSGKVSVRLGKNIKTVAVSLRPEKKWKLFEIPANHIDAGYTDYRAKSYEVHSRNIDQAVETFQLHPWYKFNLDGSFDLEQYWLHRDRARQDDVVQALKNDRMGMPGLSFTLDTGLASQEELLRLAYFSQDFSQRYGIPVEYASQTDVPAHSWALPSILHAEDVKYLVIASDPYRGPILLYGRLNEKSPFWWEGPDGSKTLTWYSWDYIQSGILFGVKRPVVQAGVTSLPIFLQPYNSSHYSPDAVMLYGNLSDNRPFNPYDVDFSQQWNRQFAFPRIIPATVPDFFHYVERNFQDSFPTLRGDGGATWEEMIAADAKHAEIMRQATERAVSAEECASLGVILNEGYKYPMDEDHRIWQNLLLYGEHSWGGISRTWLHPGEFQVKNMFRAKQAYSTQAAIQVDTLLRRGLDQLTSQVSVQGDTLLIFNPMSWERSGLVEADLPSGSRLLNPQTKQVLPIEVVHRSKEEDYERVRFWADKIPPIGYVAYPILNPMPEPPASRGLDNAAGSNLQVIENEYYKVAVDPVRGGITSIYDKQLGQELVDHKSSYAFDQYVYAEYDHNGASNIQDRTEFNSTLLQYSPALPPADLRLSTGGGGRIEGIKKTVWGTELTFVSSAAHTPKIETEIRLFDEVKLIELINHVAKEVVLAPEAVYFAFPFLAQNPTVRYEIQDGWVDPSQDELPGANTEWFSGQHWVAVTDTDHSVGLALDQAPLFTIGDINRGHWPRTLEHHNGTIFSYVMNNYNGDDELPYQGGDFTFRYVLTSEKEFDPAELARFSRDADNPLEENYVRMGFDRNEASKESLGEVKTSFLSISSRQVILSAWKAAEDGNGYILRFYNTTDRPVEAHVTFSHLLFDRILRCNAVEKDRESVETQKTGFDVSLDAHGIGTYRVIGFRRAP
jgi:alpha-mannosidase